jgi:type II secretory pathway pseudopilin PulG
MASRFIRTRLRPTLRTRSASAPARCRVADERGFTIIEVLVAASLLVIGVLATAALGTQAWSTTSATKNREGATNLARQVLDNVESVPYADVATGTGFTAKLQAKPGMTPAAGYADWTIVRRSRAYTITPTVTSVDDPSDGTGAIDPQPTDYKRVDVKVDWKQASVAKTMHLYALISPRGTADAPAVTSLSSAQGLSVTSSTVTAINFTATTSSVPAGVSWLVDGNVKGQAAGSGTTWTFTWDITGVPDGTYVLGAQAFSTSGSYGSGKSLPITLNRNGARAPTSFNAGWNPRTDLVDSRWFASPDNDVVGYTVYRQEMPSGTATKVNCGTTANPVTVVTKLECTDASPIVRAPSPAIGRRGTGTSAIAEGQRQITIVKPVGVTVGDVLFATVSGNDLDPWTAPAGWVSVGAMTNSNLQQAVFYHVAGATEPASYVFSVPQKKSLSGGIVAYTGVDNLAPIDVTAVATGTSLTATSPTLTTRYDRAKIINSTTFGTLTDIWRLSPDPTMTEQYEADASSTLTEHADSDQANAGSFGPKTAVSNNSGNWISRLTALKNGSVTTTTVVKYWAVAVDVNPTTGLAREGTLSNVVANAYVPNRAPTPISGLSCAKLGDGSSKLNWTQPLRPDNDPDTNDSILFDRVYRDGKRLDTTDGIRANPDASGDVLDNTYTDPAPGAGLHAYQVSTVDGQRIDTGLDFDGHMAESTLSAASTC